MNKNRVVLQKLKRLGYPLPNIRKALLYLNDIKISRLADDVTFTPNISRNVSGQTHNLKAQELIAKRLKLKRDELFPEADR